MTSSNINNHIKNDKKSKGIYGRGINSNIYFSPFYSNLRLLNFIQTKKNLNRDGNKNLQPQPPKNSHTCFYFFTDYAATQFLYAEYLHRNVPMLDAILNRVIYAKMNSSMHLV